MGARHPYKWVPDIPTSGQNRVPDILTNPRLFEIERDFVVSGFARRVQPGFFIGNLQNLDTPARKR